MIKNLLLVLGIVFGLGSVAEAQTWYANPTYAPSASDVAQLPYSVTFNWYVSNSDPSWTTVNDTTWIYIWPRNASGAWYRPQAYTQPTVYKDNFYPWSYSCSVVGNQFKCRDNLHGVDRYVACPASLVVGPLYKWRSLYNAAWHEQGLFWANQGPFTCNTGRSIPLQGLSVTGNGKRINCAYGPQTYQGPGTTHDIWCYRR